MSAAIAPAWPAALRSNPLSILWLIYPLLLFTLDDSVRIADLPVAPETLVLVLLILAFCCITGGGILVDLGSAAARAPRALIVLFVLLALHPVRTGDWMGLLRCAMWAVVYLFGATFAAHGQQRQRFSALWSVLALAAAGLYYAQPSLWRSGEVDILAWKHRTGLGYFLVFPLAAALLRCISGVRIWTNLLVAAALLPAFILCFSRGPWLALAGAAAMALLAWPRRRLRLAVLSLAAFLVLGLAARDTEYTHRIASIFDFDVRSSSTYRADLYRAAIEAAPQIWLGGADHAVMNQVLWANSGSQYRVLLADGDVDSDLIWVFFSGGVFALIALVWALADWCGKSYRHLRREPDSSVALCNACLLVTVVAFIFFYGVIGTPLGWLLLGIGYGAGATSPSRPATVRS